MPCWSLKLHDWRHWEAVVGNLMEVMLRKTVGSDGHPQGGRWEVITHHWGGKGSKRPNRTIKFVLQWRIVLLFQRSAFLCSPVLEPNLDLKVIKYLELFNLTSEDYTPVSQTARSCWPAQPSSWWWYSGCSGTPSPAPVSGGRCTRSCTCLLFSSELKITNIFSVNSTRNKSFISSPD